MRREINADGESLFTITSVNTNMSRRQLRNSVYIFVLDTPKAFLSKSNNLPLGEKANEIKSAGMRGQIQIVKKRKRPINSE